MSLSQNPALTKASQLTNELTQITNGIAYLRKYFDELFIEHFKQSTDQSLDQQVRSLAFKEVIKNANSLPQVKQSLVKLSQDIGNYKSKGITLDNEKIAQLEKVLNDIVNDFKIVVTFISSLQQKVAANPNGLQNSNSANMNSATPVAQSNVSSKKM